MGVPSAFIITTLVFPRLLLSADPLMLWVTLFQGVVQLGAAWYSFAGVQVASAA